MKNNQFSPKRKDKIKVIRSIIEFTILCIIFLVIIKALFTFSEYRPYDLKNASNDTQNGFVALSYFGVDRNGDETLISIEALEKQIKALYDNGYVTITQQDILNYYENRKPLPKKALFLFFEDGRKDTAIFAQKIIEKYNYKATILSYADKFEKKDSKFLMPDDLIKLKDSSFWELGTNGYRLEYINVFDRNEIFLGNLDSVTFSKEAPNIRRNYNHYLMDYIRDKDGISIENYEEMKSRIDYDYKELKDTYNKKIGYVPNLYTLMHSNTGQFGTNNRASEINEKWINEIFKMNFNREGYSLNLNNSSIYDLTRVQPQSYWSTNHLLMRIEDDTKQDTDFIIGDEKKSDKFNQIEGKSEFLDDKIILTSRPKSRGLIKLKNSENYKDVKVSVFLEGNVIGSQTVYLRASEDLNNSVGVQITNNIMNIVEKNNGNVNNLYSVNLDDINEEIDIKESANKKLDITLIDDKITVKIDDEIIVDNITIYNQNEGSIFMESAWANDGYSQRNIADDVYDGIFKELKITDKNDRILFDTSLKRKELIIYKTEFYFNKVINWFIKNF